MGGEVKDISHGAFTLEVIESQVGDKGRGIPVPAMQQTIRNNVHIKMLLSGMDQSLVPVFPILAESYWQREPEHSSS